MTDSTADRFLTDKIHLPFFQTLPQGLLQDADILKLFQLVFIPRSFLLDILFQLPVYFRLLSVCVVL